MNDYSNEKLLAPRLSRIRTFLFGAFAFVWFNEMIILGFQPLSKVWAYLWQVPLPENPQLAAALLITWGVAAPAKGALFVMAVSGLRSKNPSVRTALFASMALVPPLNIAFPFRHQGFLLGPMAVATVLSSILWGSFFLFKEPAQQPEQKETIISGQLPPSRWEIFQYAWFGAYSTTLTIMALLLLFWPRAALSFIHPCLSSLLNTDNEGLSSLIHTALASGTHLSAVATASWIATVICRSNPALRQVMTVACTVHSGLFIIFPLRQIFLDFGGNCATSSILIAFVPLFVGWVIYAVISYRVTLTKRGGTQWITM
jgi:hypothetical protein